MSEYRAALQALLDVVRKEILNDSEPAYLSPAYDMAKALLARPEPEPRITREDGEKARDWQPIATCPLVCSVVIAGEYEPGNWYVEEGIRHPDGHFYLHRLSPPTHWIPLPSPPAASDGCEQCGNTGRLTIYDSPQYIGQICSPIGDEPCPSCNPDESDGEKPAIPRMKPRTVKLEDDEIEKQGE